MTLPKKEIERKTKFLAYYQLIGGLMGLLIVVFSIFKSEFPSIKVLVIYLIGILFFAFSSYCGFRLLKDKTNKYLNFSLLNQFLQILNFHIVGYGFKYCSGLFLAFGLNSSNIGFQFELSNFEVYFNSDREIFTIGVNIFAIYLLFYIAKLQEKINQQTLLDNHQTLYEIGKVS